MSKAGEVRTSRKWFAEARRSRAMLSSDGGIHKGLRCSGSGRSSQMSAGRGKAVTGLAAGYVSLWHPGYARF